MGQVTCTRKPSVMAAGWNKRGGLSELPTDEMTPKQLRVEVMKLRLRVIVLEREIERGRPLTPTEQLNNLEDGLGMERGALRQQQ